MNYLLWSLCFWLIMGCVAVQDSGDPARSLQLGGADPQATPSPQRCRTYPTQFEVLNIAQGDAQGWVGQFDASSASLSYSRSAADSQSQSEAPRREWTYESVQDFVEEGQILGDFRWKNGEFLGDRAQRGTTPDGRTEFISTFERDKSMFLQITSWDVENRPVTAEGSVQICPFCGLLTICHVKAVWDYRSDTIITRIGGASLFVGESVEADESEPWITFNNCIELVAAEHYDSDGTIVSRDIWRGGLRGKGDFFSPLLLDHSELKNHLRMSWKPIVQRTDRICIDSA